MRFVKKVPSRGEHEYEASKQKEIVSNINISN